MNKKLFSRLYAEGLISAESMEKITLAHRTKLFSVHWEIKTILYLGVLLLSTGLGILVYKNIDTIGHQVILLFIALVCGGSFFYCIRNKLPFSTGMVKPPNAFFDYVLLLGCSTFIIFVAYLQYQYNVFGNRYGAATFFPMVVLFISAYYFDHQGILGMAITSFAAWLGLTVTPLHILESNDFDNSRVIITGLFLGVLLPAMGWFTYKKNLKRHFEFTYSNFGLHIGMISCLAAMFHFTGIYLVWFVVLLGMAYFFYKKALRERSFYYILVITLYSYIGLSYVCIEPLGRLSEDGIGAIYLGFLYFVVSGVGLIFLLIRTNKKLKRS